MIKTLPHGEMADTVNAMLSASSTVELGGKVYATDAEGLFLLPFRKALPGAGAGGRVGKEEGMKRGVRE
ncbi:hypothetical protein JCM11641_001859 [Rhodosporidiobolus odoratus]